MGRVILLLFFLVVAGPAHAERGAPSSEALLAYQQGLKHYNLSQWQLALERFQAAYLVKADPALLFNIGQCQRQLGDYRGAANSFRAFLREQRSVPATQRTQVESLLAQMELAVQESRANQPPLGVVPPPTASEETTKTSIEPAENPTVEVSAATPKKKPLHKQWWIWTIGGVAVVGVGLGVGLGLGLRGPSFPAAPGAAATVRF